MYQIAKRNPNFKDFTEDGAVYTGLINCKATEFIFLFSKKQCLFSSIINFLVSRFTLQDISCESWYIFGKYTVDTGNNLSKVIWLLN